MGLRHPVLYDAFVYISHTSVYTYNLSTGWRRCTGCLKLQVSFCKRANNYRTLLRKLTYKDKASYASSPPCICPTHLCVLCFFVKAPCVCTDKCESVRKSHVFDRVVSYVCVSCIWLMCMADVCVSYVWLMCMAHVYGSCVWLMCLAHVYGSCVWLMCLAHVFGSCVWLMCMAHMFY